MKKALLLVPALLISGCASQLVVSEYDFRPLPPDFTAMLADLNSGARQLNDFGDVNCRFETDLSTAAPMAQHIDLDINGTVGDPGSNANLLAFNGTALPCTPSLAGVAGNMIVTLNLSTEAPLALGQAVPILAASIVMDDGRVFSSDGLYGRFAVTALHAAEGTATGTFELVAVNRTDPADSRYLIMRGGLFNADD